MGKRTYDVKKIMFMLLGVFVMLIATAGFCAPQRSLTVIKNSNKQAGYATDRVIVKLKTGKGTRNLNSFLNKYKAKLSDLHIDETLYVVKLPSNVTADQIVGNKKQLLSTFTSIEDISYDYKRYLFAITPNDTYYGEQWALKADTQIYAPEAWDFFLNVATNETVIAVLDTGIRDRINTNPNKQSEIWRVPHQDLVDNLLIGQGYDFGDNDPDPSPTEYSGFADETGHGTHVAGIIAASFNNGKGVAGIVPNGIGGKKIWILPIKVADYYGDIWDSALISAINFCRDAEFTSPTTGAKLKVSVINMSLGGTVDDPYLHDAIIKFTGRGGVAVAASGNEGAEVCFPAAYDECIAVGATNRNMQVISWSNRGSSLDIVAPGGGELVGGIIPAGEGIASTVWSPSYTAYKYPDEDDVPPTPYGLGNMKPKLTGHPAEDEYGNAYEEMSGTSMACPHVAAAAAMVMALGVAGDEVRDVLIRTATPLSAEVPDPVSGYGLLNLSEALNESTIDIKFLNVSNGQVLTSNKPTIEIQFRNANIDTIRVWVDNILIIGPKSEGPKLPNWKTENLTVDGKIALLSFEVTLDEAISTHKLVARATSSIVPKPPMQPAIREVAIQLKVTDEVITKGWNLFSIPEVYSGTLLPENVLKLESGALYRWTFASTADGEYVRYVVGAGLTPKDPEASFNPPSIYANGYSLGILGRDGVTPPAGLGYWLRIGDPDGMAIPGGYGKVLSSAPYAISLYKGWNLIGNPFTYPVSWKVMLIEKDGERISISDALDRGWISGSIFRWDKNLNMGQGEYARRTPKTAVLVPWEAEWIKVRASGSKGWPIPDVKLIVPPNPYIGIIP